MSTCSPYGTLFVVATPIGNLGDMTFRAVETLKSVDLIAAEDTRHSKKLLNHFNIDTRLVSCHEHNEQQKIPLLIAHLQQNKTLALISDAGTPTISDPGYKLVCAAAKEEIPVIPVPGCSAAIAGLSVSGLPTDSFLFVGFLPRKKLRLKATLESLKEQTATLILYESPKRILQLIRTIHHVFGDRNACLVREMTKLHEEYVRGTLSDISTVIEEKKTIKGECVLFVQGDHSQRVTVTDDSLQSIIREELALSKVSTSTMARELSSRYGRPRNEIYNLILQLRNR